MQMMLGETKAVSTGRISDADRKAIITRFLSYKLSPAASVGLMLWKGKTLRGEKVRAEPEFIAEQISERLVPLFIQDVSDAIRFQGMDGLAATVPLAIHGIGAQTYETTPSMEATQLKNTYAQRVFGVKWDELSPKAQELLRENRPEIVEAERRARIDRENYDWADKRLAEQREAGRKIRRSLPLKVQKEMNALAVDVGGLSRYIGKNWYLNKKRYDEYQNKTKQLLELMLPRVISMPLYKRGSDTVKRAMLDEAIARVKSQVRQHIIRKATIADLERLTQRQKEGAL